MTGRGIKRLEPNGRDLEMARLYQEGLTLEQIGAQYGVTRERVRQLLRKYSEVTAGDGGSAVRSKRRKVAKTAVQNARFLGKYGCTFAEWQSINRFKKHTYYRSAVGAFLRQRRQAAVRKIGFDLTLLQWWAIWQDSGHWLQRGRGQGYVMCRKGDQGPYAVGNVFIALAAENSSNTKNKKSGLPIGVQKSRRGFTAFRQIDRRQLYLGTHSTPELAHAAYLAATQQPRQASGRAG